MIKIYLEMCCFNRPYDIQTAARIKLETEAKLYIQNAVLDGKLILVWSFILDYENSANPYPDHREAIAEWKTLSKHYISALDGIRELGVTIATKTGIKSKDALHVACAVEAKCDYFITTDRAFLKKAQSLPEIKTVNPIDFAILMENIR
jgi:predicted nucleic acid-binding protein